MKTTLPFHTKALYGSGSIAFGIKDQGFSALLLLFYNQVVGLPAAWVGAAIMIALIVDALADPLIGQLSDNFSSRLGRRHPFMYGAALPTGIFFALLWTPIVGSHELQFAYLLLMAIAVRVSLSFFEIPALALVAEFSSDYDERTNIVSYRYFFNFLGGFVMTVLALKVFFKSSPGYPMGQLDPAGYTAYGVMAGAVMMTVILIATVSTHSRIPTLRAAPVKDRQTLGQTFSALLDILRDRAYTSVLLGWFFFAVVAGLNATLNTYIATYYWGFSADKIAMVAVGAAVGVLGAVFIAQPLSRRYGKKNAAVGLFGVGVTVALLPISLHQIGLFPGPGTPALPLYLAIQTLIGMACIVAAVILAVSMVADVGEHLELKTGRRAEGLMFSAVIMINKAVSGMGIFLSGLVLAAVGFPENAKADAVPPLVLNHLALSYISILVVFTALSLISLSFYRITREDHEAALAKLAAAKGSQTAP